MVDRHSPERRAQFMAKVVIDEGTGCWIWTGSRKPNGYAAFRQWREAGGGYAHRWAYEHFHGEIPDGLHLDHTCGRGRDGCVNWQHLEAVTQAENNLRMRARMGLLEATCRRCGSDDFYVQPSNGLRRCRECRRRLRRAEQQCVSTGGLRW